MNEKRIQEVLEIERQAQAIRDAAVAEAARIPALAERDAQELLEKNRKTAELEARRLIDNAQADEECANILNQAEEKISRSKTLASTNFDRAVSYVLARVIGQE